MKGKTIVQLTAATTYYIQIPANLGTSTESVTALEITKPATSGTIGARDLNTNSYPTLSWAYNDGVLTINGNNSRYAAEISDSEPYQTFKDYITTIIVNDGIIGLDDNFFANVNSPTIILKNSCSNWSYSFEDCTVGKLYIDANTLHQKIVVNGEDILEPILTTYSRDDGRYPTRYLRSKGDKDVYFLSSHAYWQAMTLYNAICADYDKVQRPHEYWGRLHAPIAIQVKVGDDDEAVAVDLATCYDDGSKIESYTFSAADVLAKNIVPCYYTWKVNGEEIEYGKVFTNVSANILIEGTLRETPLHDYTTLGEDPEKNGLYKVCCANNPVEFKESTRVIKDYAPNATGLAKHLELTVNDQDNSYSTAEAIALTDANQFKDVNVKFTSASNPTYTRTITTEWGTLVVPFEISATQSGFEFYNIKEIVNNKALILEKVGGNTITAGSPVFVRRTGANTSLTLTATGKTVNTEMLLGDLKGSYAEQNLTTGYIINNDMLWSVAALVGDEKTVKMAPFHAYLDTESNGAKLQIFVEEESTSINSEQLIMNNEAGAVYNLQGQRLSAPQKGVNIINGKKVMVK